MDKKKLTVIIACAVVLVLAIVFVVLMSTGVLDFNKNKPTEPQTGTNASGESNTDKPQNGNSQQAGSDESGNKENNNNGGTNIGDSPAVGEPGDIIIDLDPSDDYEVNNNGGTGESSNVEFDENDVLEFDDLLAAAEGNK